MKARLPLCALAVLILAGAPLSCETSSSGNYVEACESVEVTVKFCSNPEESLCQGVPAEFADLCRDGCVQGICDKYYRCERNPGPRWCGTSCADRQAAQYWNIFLQAQLYCEYETRGTHHAQPGYRECIVQRAETVCPELKGTGWTDDFGEMNFGALYQNYGARFQTGK